MAELVTSSNAMPDTPSKDEGDGCGKCRYGEGRYAGCLQELYARPANERSERLDIIPEGQPAWLVLRIERIR